jgi:hypothetical protein
MALQATELFWGAEVCGWVGSRAGLGISDNKITLSQNPTPW